MFIAHSLAYLTIPDLFKNWTEIWCTMMGNSSTTLHKTAQQDTTVSRYHKMSSPQISWNSEIPRVGTSPRCLKGCVLSLGNFQRSGCSFNTVSHEFQHTKSVPRRLRERDLELNWQSVRYGWMRPGLLAPESSTTKKKKSKTMSSKALIWSFLLLTRFFGNSAPCACR